MFPDRHAADAETGAEGFSGMKFTVRKTIQYLATQLHGGRLA